MRQILPYRKLLSTADPCDGCAGGMSFPSMVFPVARFPYLRVACFIFGAIFRTGPDESKEDEGMFPPSRIFTLDPYSGSIVEERWVTPLEAGLDWGVRTPLPGPIRNKAQQRGESFGFEYDGVYKELARLSPRVWKAFEENSMCGATRSLVEEYRRFFSDVMEIPLLPYYMYLGREFWAWVHAVTGAVPAAK